MEATVKKYQQKFKKVKDDMDRWDDLQTRLISQFRNASSIIGRLQLLEDPKNYGSLKNIDNIKDSIFGKQMESLQMIMLSMNKTL
ncbi:putative casein Kinase 2 substrate [Helianthus annuus]|nr:putative casein Kinase 2 substrate [Helianthus annuus]KAJ0747227.1 putative casein Kinase 2 substrate [Helianthus annuus]